MEMKSQQERLKLYRQILWDYNYTPEEIDEVLCGRKKKAGHLDKQALFVRLLESYSWYTLMDLFTLTDIKEMLSDEVINKIRFASLRTRYEFVQRRLQEIIPVTG